MTLDEHEGRQRWIESQAKVFEKWRGMTPGQALEAAHELFRKFWDEDRKRPIERS